jgi:hypothetical protein
MKRIGETAHQNNGINKVIESIRENTAQEKGSRPVITSEGKRFLQTSSQTAARSNSGSGVV